MKLSETYHALAERIRETKTLAGLDIRQSQIDRHHANQTLTDLEFRDLDIMIMTRRAKLETSEVRP